MNFILLFLAFLFSQGKPYQRYCDCNDCGPLCIPGYYVRCDGNSVVYDLYALRDYVYKGNTSNPKKFVSDGLSRGLCQSLGYPLGGGVTKSVIVRDVGNDAPPGNIWGWVDDIYDNEYMCLVPETENCHNAKDDDNDGLVDCADPDCFGSPDCRRDDCVGCCATDGSPGGTTQPSQGLSSYLKKSNESCTCPKDPKPCEPSAGDPVEVNSGRQRDSREDLTVSGRVPLTILPYFSSTSDYEGPLGYGYTSLLTVRLFSWDDGTWSLRDERGDREDFDANGRNLNHLISMADLTLTTDSAFWEPGSGKVYAFSRKDGVLGTLRDRKGGGILLTYADSAGNHVKMPVKGISYKSWPSKFRGVVAYDYRVTRLTSVDNPSQTIDLGYDTTGHLATATDFSGRQVQYTYDLAGNQTRVSYPDGSLRRFFYQDPVKLHRLTAFDDKPIRAALATDTAVLTRNLYDGKDRVSLQNHQGATYGFAHAAWRDTTYHTLSFQNQRAPVGTVWRVTTYLRSTTDTQTIPDGRGGLIRRVVTYDDSVVNFAPQDSNEHSYGDLVSPMAWAGRTVRMTDAMGADIQTRTIFYDRFNNVIEQDEPDGTVARFQRDSLARVILQSESPPSGHGTDRYTRYTYDGTSDRITRQVDGTALDSTVKDRTYDANGNVLTESVWRDPEAKISTSWTYDANGRVVTETDPLGNVKMNIYLATTSVQPDSVQFPDLTGERHTRDGFGRITQTRNQMGKVAWTKYDALGRDTVNCGYDSLCTRKTYNGPDLVRLEEGLKAKSSGGYVAALRVAKYDLDGYGRRVKEWLQSGSRWVLKKKHVLDALGNEVETWDNPDSTNTDSTKWRLVERKIYDGRSHLLQRRQFPNGPGVDSLVTIYKPDANGNVISETDPRGGAIRRLVDSWGNALSDTNPVKRITSRTFDHRNLVVSEADAYGHVVSHSYDAQGHEVQRIGFHGDTSLWIYSKGRLVKERSPEGNWTTYAYDVRGRVTRIAQKVGDTLLAVDSNDVFTDYAYDALGRRVKESLRMVVQRRYGLDAGGRVALDTNALGQVTKYLYDALGRQVRQITPASDTFVTDYDLQGRPWIRRILSPKRGADTLSVTRYDDADRPIWERTPGSGAIAKVYDGTEYLKQTTDSAGIVTILTQDRMGRDSLVSVAGKTARKTVRDPAGRVVQQWDERGYRIAMTYDSLDRLRSLQDNESNTTTFTYVDSAGGWRRTTTYPDAKKESHLYDREGRLRRFVDGRGYQTVYRYDSLSRLVGVDYLTSTGTSAGTSLALSYDRLGRLSKASQGTVSVDSSTYDALGRPLTSRQTVSGTVYTLGYSYSDASRTRTLTLPNGSTVKQKWTPRGLMDSLWAGGRLLARFGYKFGLETSRNLGNGIAIAEGYDAAGRPASLSDTLVDQTLPKLAFAYDAYGNRKLILRNHYSATSEAVGYTPDNQVNTWGMGTADANGSIASPTSSQSWTLDSRGNWSSWTQTGTAQARTHTAANELMTMGSTPLTWDAAGNLTSDGTLTYVWGPRGTLDTVKQSTTVKGLYGYDPLGRRALKTVGTLKTISVYDGWQCVYQKVTGSGTDTTKAYTFGNYIDEPVSLTRKWGSTTDTVWYLQGNNYNVEALTDRTGAVVERYEYSPYGKVTVYTGKGTDGKWFTSDDVSATLSARGNALTFQGRELDAESGNYYFRNRYYQATLGKFVSRDPIGFDAGDINILRFVGGRPLTSLDPLGLEKVSIPLTYDLGEDGKITGSYLTSGGGSSAFDNAATPMVMANIYLNLAPGKGCNSCISLKWKQKIYQVSNGVRTPKSGWSDDGPTEGVGQSAEAKSYWFWDHPQQPLPGYPRENYTFRARLNLSCIKKDGSTKALFSLEWGYGMNGAKLNPYPPRKQ